MAITTLMQRTTLDFFRLSMFSNSRPEQIVEQSYDYLDIDDDEPHEELPLRKQCVGDHVISTFRDGATTSEGAHGTLTVSADGKTVNMQFIRGGSIKFDLISNSMHVAYPDGHRKRYALNEQEKQAIRAPHKLSLDVKWLPTDSDGTHHFQWSANVWSCATVGPTDRFW